MNTYLSFEIPNVNNGVDSWHMNLLTVERNSALEIPQVIEERYNNSMVMPDNIKIVNRPVDIEIENDAGYLLIRNELTGGKLIITRKIKLNHKIIDQSKYSDFKKIMDIWNNRNYKQIMLK